MNLLQLFQERLIYKYIYQAFLIKIAIVVTITLTSMTMTIKEFFIEVQRF